MNNKKIALWIVIVLCITNAAWKNESYANIQIPVESVTVDDVHYILGQDVVTGKPVLRPTMTVSWNDPDSWDVASDPMNVHEPDYYEVTVFNRTKGNTDTIKISKGTEAYNNKTIDIHEEVVLDTGCLYEIAVQPYHYHTVVIDGQPTYVLAPTVGGTEKAFAITDVYVDLVPDDTSISVVWDSVNIADMPYRIVYATGDYSNKSKQELLNNKEGEITDLKASDPEVEEFYDPVTKRNKLKYTLTHNIYPGQIYSIMVEPVQEYFEGEPVTRNRNYPHIFTCSTNINLEVYEDGQYVRLEWDIPANFKLGQGQDEYELVEARLVEYLDGQGRNLVVFDDKAANMEYYKVPKPDKEVEYQLLLRYEAVSDSNKIPIEPESEKVPYVPINLQIQPTKPYVPNVINQKIIEDLKNNYTVDEIKALLQEKYLVEGHYYTGNIDNLLDQDITFHVDDDDEHIHFVWGSFRHKDTDPTSPTFGNSIIDTNTYYDIYVTKELEDLTTAIKIVDNQKYTDPSSSNTITNSSGDILGFRHILDYYYDPNYSELQKIVPNQMYYIKIVAKKVWGTQESVSEPTIVSIYYGYDGDTFEPPSIVKPPLKIKEDEVTTDAVGVTWKENWWEVIAKDPIKYDKLSSWSHQVWVEENGTIHTEPTAETECFTIYKNEAEIDRLIAYVRACSVEYADFDVYRREIDLGSDAFGVSDVQYKFYQIPYAQVQNEIDTMKLTDPTYSFSDYYSALVQGDKDGTQPIAWKDIQPLEDDMNVDYLYYVEEGLSPNSLYLFLVYPYRVVHTGDLVMAHYPAAIVVATEDDASPINPEPTVPALHIADYTDTSITVSWKYNTAFTYELKYSDKEDFTTAQDVVISLPSNPLDPEYPTDGSFYEVVIDDLFPDSEYYFWIKANNPETGTMSVWSNPYIGHTKDVSNPRYPKGIGLASLQSMRAHGYDKNVDSDFISIEWLLHADDVPNEEGSQVKKSYAYIMEVADNPQFIDPIYMVNSGGENDVQPTNVEFLDKNLVKINNLLPNRHYYIRMKTRLTITGSEDGQTIVKESSTYSKTIKITTVPTDGEFDTDVDTDFDLLPTDNYEFIYDEDDEELEYRFRGMEDEDYHTDQRLISELIQKNQYTFYIDIARYEGKSIERRKVTIPYSIITAFDEFKVDLTIDTGDMLFTLPYGAIASHINKEVNSYGEIPTVHIMIEPYNGKPSEEYLSAAKAQGVMIVLRSNKGNKKIDHTDKALSVDLKTTTRYNLYDKKAIAYQKDYKNQWQEADAEYNAYEGYMTIKTSVLGTYGVYLIDGGSSISSNSGHWAQSYMKSIYNKFTIAGLETTVDLDDKVSETQVANILLSILSDKHEVDVKKPIASSQKKQMVTAKIILDNEIADKPLTREEAISMFTRTYEILNGEVPIRSQVANQIQKNAGISQSYSSNIAKAYEIGFMLDPENLRPKEYLTYGELFSIWDKVSN